MTDFLFNLLAIFVVVAPVIIALKLYSLVKIQERILDDLKFIRSDVLKLTMADLKLKSTNLEIINSHKKGDKV